MKKRDYYLDLTKKLRISVLSLANTININIKSKIILNQIIRSATSIGANYKSVCRTHSDAEFVSRLVIVEEEANETFYWLEILKKSGIIKADASKEIKKLANHIIIAFAIASKKTKKKRLIK